jgi:hypothetical protein
LLLFFVSGKKELYTRPAYKKVAGISLDLRGSFGIDSNTQIKKV